MMNPHNNLDIMTAWHRIQFLNIPTHSFPKFSKAKPRSHLVYSGGIATKLFQRSCSS